MLSVYNRDALSCLNHTRNPTNSVLWWAWFSIPCTLNTDCICRCRLFWHYKSCNKSSIDWACLGSYWQNIDPQSFLYQLAEATQPIPPRLLANVILQVWHSHSTMLCTRLVSLILFPIISFAHSPLNKYSIILWVKVLFYIYYYYYHHHHVPMKGIPIP